MNENLTDHDLLVTLHEQIKGVREDIKEIKDGTSEKLSDHEMRLRRIELWGGIAIGFSYALNLFFHFIK